MPPEKLLKFPCIIGGAFLPVHTVQSPIFFLLFDQMQHLQYRPSLDSPSKPVTLFLT